MLVLVYTATFIVDTVAFTFVTLLRRWYTFVRLVVVGRFGTRRTLDLYVYRLHFVTRLHVWFAFWFTHLLHFARLRSLPGGLIYVLRAFVVHGDTGRVPLPHVTTCRLTPLQTPVTDYPIYIPHLRTYSPG